jgi:NADH dehydrogenase FAD-containing subunit
MTGYVPRDLESWQRRALRVQLARVTQVLADTVVWTAGMLASSLTRQIPM